MEIDENIAAAFKISFPNSPRFVLNLDKNVLNLDKLVTDKETSQKIKC